MIKASRKPWDTVAIVGVGLIGGSIGLGLLRRGLARHVVGIGRRAATLRVARRLGAVTSGTLDLARGVASAELVIVCTPVSEIVRHVRAAARTCRRPALITDVGSTKAEIVAALAHGLPPGVAFVGSHPLAGSQRNGPAAAAADLLEGRTVVVTPTAATRARDTRALARLWTSLGAKVVRMSAQAHDRALAATSHLPHLAASALANATPGDDLRLAATGWLDTTRVAGGDPRLWQQIFLTNRANVLSALGRYEDVLASLRRSLERGDATSLEKILTQAKRKRDALGS